MNANTRHRIKTELKMKRCKYCKDTENLTIDHKVPISQGGKNEFKNLQCLCKRCNILKSGLSDRQVRNLWKWFLAIQKSRIEHKKNPYQLF